MTALPQHMISLSKANRIRIARATLKHEITSGERSAATVILQCPDEAATMTVFNVLIKQHGWGDRRVRKLLTVAQVRESKTVGELTDRQRKTIIDLLEWGVA